MTIRHEKKNLFIVGFTTKRSSWQNPILSIYGIYSRSESNYAVIPAIDNNIISIYSPHFFKRYRERLVKDDSISDEGIIRQYFKSDWGFMGAVVNEDLNLSTIVLKMVIKTIKLVLLQLHHKVIV